jgi:hypothetical protein
MADFDNTPAAPVAFAAEQWSDVRAVLTGAVDPTTIIKDDEVDDEPLPVGARFLYAGPGPAAGIYSVGLSSSARAEDADAAVEFRSGRMVRATGGTSNLGRWVLTTTGDITLGTTSLTFEKPSAGAATLAAATAFDNSPPETINL